MVVSGTRMNVAVSTVSQDVASVPYDAAPLLPAANQVADRQQQVNKKKINAQLNRLKEQQQMQAMRKKKQEELALAAPPLFVALQPVGMGAQLELWQSLHEQIGREERTIPQNLTVTQPKVTKLDKGEEPGGLNQSTIRPGAQGSVILGERLPYIAATDLSATKMREALIQAYGIQNDNSSLATSGMRDATSTAMPHVRDTTSILTSSGVNENRGQFVESARMLSASGVNRPAIPTNINDNEFRLAQLNFGAPVNINKTRELAVVEPIPDIDSTEKSESVAEIKDVTLKRASRDDEGRSLSQLTVNNVRTTSLQESAATPENTPNSSSVLTPKVEETVGQLQRGLNYKFTSWNDGSSVRVELAKAQEIHATASNDGVQQVLDENQHLLETERTLVIDEHRDDEERKQRHQKPDNEEEGS
ncbi:putative type III secretion protein [Yersinia ruckeri]|nr:putative type III secretion protein [Yersinia ruckeri]